MTVTRAWSKILQLVNWRGCFTFPLADKNPHADAPAPLDMKLGHTHFQGNVRTAIPWEACYMDALGWAQAVGARQARPRAASVDLIWRIHIDGKRQLRPFVEKAVTRLDGNGNP